MTKGVTILPLSSLPFTLFEQAFESLRILQQRNRFVGQGAELPFGLSETHVMVELDRYPHHTASQLSELLGLERSSISRALAALKRRGYLGIERSSEATKGSSFKITAKGKKTLAEYDRMANDRLTSFCSVLKESEVEALRRYFCHLANNAGVQVGTLRPADHALRGEIRRITRALGLLRANFLGSGLSPSQWQLLSEIELGRGRRIAAELSSALHLAPNTISLTLTRLKARGFIAPSSIRLGGRKKGLMLTPEGSHTLANLKREGALLFKRLLADLSEQEVRAFNELFAKFSGQTDSSRMNLLGSSATHQELKSPAERASARTFLLGELVHQNLHRNAPQSLLYPSHFLSALLIEGRLVGICEIEHQGDRGIVRNILLSAAFDSPASLKRFFDLASHLFQLSRGAAQIVADEDSYVRELLSR